MATTDDEAIELARNESKGWKLIVREFDWLMDGADFNDARVVPLVRAIQAWGEFLVELRLSQTPTVVGQARADALLNYLRCGRDLEV